MKNALELTEQNFAAEVLESDKPVLVDFWAEWCGPCKMLGPVIEEIATERAGVIKVGKVDIAAHPELAARYNISAIPALLYFRGGEVQGQIRGLSSKKNIVSGFNLPATVAKAV